MSKSEMIWKQYKDIVKLKAEAGKQEALVIDMGTEIDRLVQARIAAVSENHRLAAIIKDIEAAKAEFQKDNQVLLSQANDYSFKHYKLKCERDDLEKENVRLHAVIKELEGVHWSKYVDSSYEVKT